MNTTMRSRDAASLEDFESWLVAREGALHRTALLLTGDPHTADDLVQHVIFVRVDSSGEALVRLGLDGSLELATPVRKPTLGGYLLPG